MFKPVKSVKEKAEKFSVDVFTVDHRGMTFGAGRCIVTLGNAPMEGIALMAGDSRYVTTEEHSLKWLTDRGLPYAVATELLAEATR